MPKKEGAAASSALFLWAARCASGNGISPCKTALSRSPQAPFSFSTRSRQSLPGDARRGRSPFAFLPQAGACTPPRNDFSIRQRTKNGCSPMLHPSPKQLISFSAGNLRESLRGPQPFQLSFVSRRPAHPAVPRAKGLQPLRLPSAGGGVYPAEERFFYPSAHKKRMKPNAPSVPETAYFLFSREPPGELERAAALSTFLRIPATCAPRRFPLPRGCAKGPQPLCLPSAGGGVYPVEERFFHPSAHKKRM